MSHAALGVALVIALETLHVSDTTLSLVSCQRLRHYDLKRVVQIPTMDIDLFGGSLDERLTGEQAQASSFLKTRKSRKRNVRQLAMAFAMTSDDQLGMHFGQHFPHSQRIFLTNMRKIMLIRRLSGG